MRSILFVLLILFSATISAAEDILVAFHTTDSKLILLKVNFANNKYTIVDRAVFALTSQGGLTGVAPLSGGNYQVAWNQRDTTNKIKALSMTLGPGLDAIGTTKKFPPALTAFYNFNILPDGDQFSIDFSNNVMLRSRASNGNMGGAQGKLFDLPQGFDPIDTSFTKRQTVANGLNSPTVGDEAFFTLSYVPSINRYGFTIYAPGNASLSKERAEDPQSGLYTGDVTGTEIWIPIDAGPGCLIFYTERVDGTGPNSANSPAAPVKIALRSQKINLQTLRPEGNSVQLVPPKPADLLGTVVFFNMFTVATEQQAVTAAGAKATGGAHVFYLEQTTACRSSLLKAFHVNGETGKKNSGFSTLIGCSDPIIQPGSKFLYGLSAEAIPGT